jgi:hypothetical protein
VSNPSEGLFDCPEKTRVGLMQLYLKFRFGIRIRLVDGIAPVAPGGRDWTRSFGTCDGHFAPSF